MLRPLWQVTLSSEKVNIGRRKSIAKDPEPKDEGSCNLNEVINMGLSI